MTRYHSPRNSNLSLELLQGRFWYHKNALGPKSDTTLPYMLISAGRKLIPESRANVKDIPRHMVKGKLFGCELFRTYRMVN